MIIREATAEDAVAACRTMRRSIAELCEADHHDDPDILQRWLNNKTPEIFKTWINPDHSLLVATEADTILAVGCITSAGKITLNYVSPDARFRGVSSAVLTVLERCARKRGNATCELESTETARRFYLTRGYSEIGTARAVFD